MYKTERRALNFMIEQVKASNLRPQTSLKRKTSIIHSWKTWNRADSIISSKIRFLLCFIPLSVCCLYLKVGLGMQESCMTYFGTRIFRSRRKWTSLLSVSLSMRKLFWDSPLLHRILLISYWLELSWKPFLFNHCQEMDTEHSNSG